MPCKEYIECPKKISEALDEMSRDAHMVAQNETRRCSDAECEHYISKTALKELEKNGQITPEDKWPQGCGDCDKVHEYSSLEGAGFTGHKYGSAECVWSQDDGLCVAKSEKENE